MNFRQNPMCYVFPRIVSCDYHRFGSGGKQENLNSICILSLNVINDKVFLGKSHISLYISEDFSKKQLLKLFQYTNINLKSIIVIWWWFLFLILLGAFRMVFRLIQVNSVHLRFLMLDLRMHRC